MKLRVLLLLLIICAFNESIIEAQGIRFAGSEYANFSVEIRDISTGKRTASINSEKMLTPASTMKLVTSAAALSKYGPEFRYSTTATFIGEIKGETAVGNIVITGAGDPTLYSRHFEENQTFIPDIVDAVSKLGVGEICGEIVLDDRCMPDYGPLSTWLIEDSFYAYGTGIYPLNFRDNIFRVSLEDLSTNPRYTDADITYDFVAGEDLQRFHGVFSDSYILRGDAPLHTSVTFPHNNPMSSFSEELQFRLAESGIRLSDEYCEPSTSPQKMLLATYKSPELLDILKSMMFRSDNMMAETTLRLLAPGLPLQDALDEEKLILKDKLGIENRYVKILDGSGLTRKNFVSAQFLGNILLAMAKSGFKSEYVSLFPKVGIDGTVRNFMAKTPYKGRLVMKSGSMGGVRSYAGYLLDSNGNPRKTVVIIINDFVAPTSEVNKGIEKFLVKELGN